MWKSFPTTKRQRSTLRSRSASESSSRLHLSLRQCFKLRSRSASESSSRLHLSLRQCFKLRSRSASESRSRLHLSLRQCFKLRSRSASESRSRLYLSLRQCFKLISRSASESRSRLRRSSSPSPSRFSRLYCDNISRLRSLPTAPFRAISRQHSKSKSLHLKYKHVRWRLVPRKSSEIHFLWKYSILMIMVIVTALHLLTTRCVKVIMDLYVHKNLCFLSTGDFRPDTICDYLHFSPLIGVLFAIFWFEVFLFSERGGNTVVCGVICDQPWRNVIPAVVCFAVATIMQFAYIIVLHSRKFCDDTKYMLKDEEKMLCQDILMHERSFSTIFAYVYHSAMLSFIFWLIATTIMVMRILLAPDFKFVIDKQPEEKITPAMSSDDNDNSKGKLIFVNRESVDNQSVRILAMRLDKSSKDKSNFTSRGESVVNI